MEGDVWDENSYKNWVRGAKGLEFLQEGLHTFVGDKAPEVRDQQLQNITKSLIGSTPQCRQCTSKNLLPDHAKPKKACDRSTCIQKQYKNCFGIKPWERRKCPNGICSKLYDAIVYNHRFRDPLWENTDPTTWCTDPQGWSFMKCFETTPGPGTSAKNTDASGLISILINNLSMQNWLACHNMGKQTACLFYESRCIRNDILHKPKMELKDPTLVSYIDTFIAVLKDSKCLLTYAGSQDAVKKLTQLKAKQINISQGDVENIMKKRKDALLEIEERQQEAKLEIERTSASGLTSLTRTKAQALQEMQDTTSYGVTTIASKATDALQEMQLTSNTGVIELTKTKTEAVSEIQVSTSIGVTEVTKITSEAVRKIQDTTVSGVTEVNKTKTEAVSEIQEVKSNILEELKEQQISSAASAGTEPLTPTDVKELKKDMIDFYRERYSTLPLSPLIENVDAPLVKFFVMPDIYSVIIQRFRGGGNEIKTGIKSLREIFIKKDELVRIYLSADAGLGKTAFSQRLALTWCQGHEPKEDEEEYYQEDELNALKYFDFLFLLLLRDSADKCDIYDLIINQIIQELPLRSTLSVEDLEKLLLENKCLVILDGLDEWTHPTSCRRGPSDIPHMRFRNCTVLTTSRPWKLSVINIKDSQIDQRLELVKLNDDAKHKLKGRVISQLSKTTDENILAGHLRNYTTAVTKHDFSELEAIPLLLMYLLTLWWAEEIQELGDTQCLLYSNIVELLLSRTVKKNTDISLDLPQAEQSVIPQCFRKQQHCTKFYQFLTRLAQLAFDTLFSTARESALVFDNSIAEKLLNKELLEFCLQSGLLNQSKSRANIAKQETKLSFAHKTVQEFFAAFYMHCTPDKNKTQNTLLSQCKSIKDILEISKLFIFLCGINVKVASILTPELLKVILGDEITSQYRTTTNVTDVAKYFVPINEIQNMLVSCLIENPHNADLKLFCQDIIIDKNCRQENYYKHLQQLAVRNKADIRSISIRMEEIPHSVQEIIADFELTELSSVINIDYIGTFDDCDIEPLLQGSVKRLALCSQKWTEDHFVGKKSSWSPSISDRLYSLANLDAINIDGFMMRHDQFELLVKHLSARISMREIFLLYLRCAEHGRSCTGCSLELSQHSQLRMLTLGFIPLSELNINVSSLEDCRVGHINKPGVVSRLLRSLPAVNKLHHLLYFRLESEEDIDAMLETLNLLVHVKNVSLWEIDLGNRAMNLNQMVNVERVTLSKVSMSASVLKSLTESIRELPQLVTLRKHDCTITPHKQFERERMQGNTSRDCTADDNDVGKELVLHLDASKMEIIHNKQ